MRTKPIVSWSGGKSRLLKHLLPMVPAKRGYIELFGGGLALLLAKPRSKLEVINDWNGQLINLYRIVKHHPDALISEMEFMMPSREVLRECIDQIGLTDLQRAARYLHANKTSFAGGGQNYAVTKNTESSAMASREGLLTRVREMSVRLSGVSIENLDWRRCLELYDHSDNFIFADPPYLNAQPKNYVGWTESEMREFAARMEEVSAEWVITVDDSPTTRTLWSAHDVKTVRTRNGYVNQRLCRDRTFGELIIRRRRRMTVSVAA